MPDGPPEDEKRLRAVLESLASDADSLSTRGREISSTGGTVAMEAVLREIEQTVLPRRLTFASGSDVQLVFDVTERRILAFGSDLSNTQENLSREQAELVADHLRSFCNAAEIVHVRCDVTVYAEPGGETGVSLPDLLPYLAADLDLPGQTVPVNVAIAESRPFTLALLDTGVDGAATVEGQDSIGARLRQLEESFQANLDAKPGDKPRCRIWVDQIPGTFAVLLVQISRRRIWLAFEVDHLDACIACWSRVG